MVTGNDSFLFGWRESGEKRTSYTYTLSGVSQKTFSKREKEGWERRKQDIFNL